ncbi:hypothetical protein GGX14DRAFT_535168 [Mycena pura]|uniref:IRG-type G domain-containing protein n=1 Tax=Mycena pura TaxID=153505 RepID=A0AAD6YG38_9AGAR|nr:hypothetical protein GGX14DRAFT_535168 [Mycena pura]
MRDAGAAAAGVTETTLRVARSPDPSPRNPCVWYDVPGVGTLRVRDWRYFNKQGLYVFDTLAVLVDNRFTMTDVAAAILRSVRRFGIPCCIVCSKADSHARNLMREMEHESDTHFVRVTRQNVREKQRVYVVSDATVHSATKGNVATKTPTKIFRQAAARALAWSMEPSAPKK